MTWRGWLVDIAVDFPFFFPFPSGLTRAVMLPRVDAYSIVLFSVPTYELAIRTRPGDAKKGVDA